MLVSYNFHNFCSPMRMSVTIFSASCLVVSCWELHISLHFSSKSASFVVIDVDAAVLRSSAYFLKFVTNVSMSVDRMVQLAHRAQRPSPFSLLCVYVFVFAYLYWSYIDVGCAGSLCFRLLCVGVVVEVVADVLRTDFFGRV